MTIGQYDTETRLCPTCRATAPGTGDMVTVVWAEDGVAVTQVHAADCADFLAQERRIREGAELTRQEEERAQQLFPDAHARFQAALQALPAEQAASPFAAALAELVAIQADLFHDGGGFVVLPHWADILDRHFPAADD
ncbi:hypothetical protein ACIBI9_65910 [Nonomuraea sp. NPDC050451]|uniref:hypothetical protein n=1 Tax=Nonomuraea sp. NPDC050451 TaxID=3364364 RepID=UPI0037A3C8E9